MALQNLQQYGCQTGNKLKEKSPIGKPRVSPLRFLNAGTESAEVATSEKSRDLNRNSSRNKNETMFGSGYENFPEFGVLDGVIFKLNIL